MHIHPAEGFKELRVFTLSISFEKSPVAGKPRGTANRHGQLVTGRQWCKH
jgi:hypothetical protein